MNVSPKHVAINHRKAEKFVLFPLDHPILILKAIATKKHSWSRCFIIRSFVANKAKCLNFLKQDTGLI